MTWKNLLLPSNTYVFKAHITHKTTRAQFTLTHTKLYGLCARQMNKWMFIWKKFACTLLRENYNSCFLFHSHFALFIPLVPFFSKHKIPTPLHIDPILVSSFQIYMRTLCKKMIWNRHPHIRRRLKGQDFFRSLVGQLVYLVNFLKTWFLASVFIPKFPWV